MPTARNTCDGDAYIHNLAAFIRSHERQLANALMAYKKSCRRRQEQRYNRMQKQGDHRNPSGKSTGGNDTTNSSNYTANGPDSNADSTTTSTWHPFHPSTASTLQMAKPVRLSMSLHHLYYLLGRFQDLGIDVGPMSVRLDSIDSETSGNYVSFLSEFQRKKLMPSDTQSIHSISSVKSVMSSVSALWSRLGSSSRKYDNIPGDLRYLHSAFSKLPCLRLAHDPKAKLIKGHEEYPFETATPIDIFQNLVVLELCDIDPKEVYGWDTLSNSIRYLVIKRACVTDPADILVYLVRDDAEKRSGGLESTPDSAIVEDQAESIAISSLARQPLKTQDRSKISTSPLSSSFMRSTPTLLSSSIPSAHHSPHMKHIRKQSSGSSDDQPYPYQPLLSASSSVKTLGGIPQRRPYYYFPQRSQHRHPHRSNSILSDGGRRTNLITLSPSSAGRPTSDDSNDSNKHWRLLKHLSFTENQIANVSAWCFDGMRNLSSLDLSHNLLKKIPTAALVKLRNLKSLNLSFNQLVSTKGFPVNLKRLSILNLRGNRLTDLESIEKLKSLERVDLRQNRLAKMTDIKPVLLVNRERVSIKTIFLAGNPLASSRGYRIQLFNLFNGVDPHNNVKIDGSRPGIFESRLLLDSKGAAIALQKFMDASIINKIAASVSNMNLNKVMTTRTTKETAPVHTLGIKVNNKPRISLGKKHSTSSTKVNSCASSQHSSEHSQVLTPNANALNAPLDLLAPKKPYAVPRSLHHRTSTLSTLLDRMSLSSSPRALEPSEGPETDRSGESSDDGINPIAKLSIACPALPAIAQTTTVSTYIESVDNTNSRQKKHTHAKSVGAVPENMEGSSYTLDSSKGRRRNVSERAFEPAGQMKSGLKKQNLRIYG